MLRGECALLEAYGVRDGSALRDLELAQDILAREACDGSLKRWHLG